MLGLGAELNLGKSTMTGVIDRMEAAGLVERRPDPHDRRHLLVAATAEGSRRGALLQERLRARVLALLAPLDSGDRDALGAILSRVLAGAENLLPSE